MRGEEWGERIANLGKWGDLEIVCDRGKCMATQMMSAAMMECTTLHPLCRGRGFEHRTCSISSAKVICVPSAHQHHACVGCKPGRQLSLISRAKGSHCVFASAGVAGAAVGAVAKGDTMDSADVAGGPTSAESERSSSRVAEARERLLRAVENVGRGAESSEGDRAEIEEAQVREASRVWTRTCTLFEAPHKQSTSASTGMVYQKPDISYIGHLTCCFEQSDVAFLTPGGLQTWGP